MAASRKGAVRKQSAQHELNLLPAGSLLDAEMLRSFGLDELLPAPLAEWRPLVADGLNYFLASLPASRLLEIIADQLQLPATATSARRLVTLLAHCPTLHKIGQVLARHHLLHPELRRQLQALESMPAITPFEQALATIRQELSVWAGTAGERAELQLGTQALAEGSVAIVVPFTYRSTAANAKLRHGVLKVLKPAIEEKLTAELAILVELGCYLERRSQQLGLPQIDYHDTLETVRRLMIKEVRLDIEQHNLKAAATFYSAEPRILIPHPLPWCTPRMTAMERVFGHKATDLDLPLRQRRALADTMISALLAQPFWSDAPQAVFHADLHGGNLFLTADGRLAILDWSLIACIGKAEREALVAIVLGGLTLDASRMCQAISTLGTLRPDDPLLVETVEKALDAIVRRGALPGFDWLVALLDDLALHAITGVWEDFVLLRKTWLSLSGVIGDLAGDTTPDAQIVSMAVQRLLAELPARALAHPDTTHFSTHVSNAEILGLCLSPWLVTTRYWLRLMAGAWQPAGLLD